MEYIKQKKIENDNLFEKQKIEWENEGNFSKYNISEKSITNLKKKGFNYLFPIQQKTFNSLYNRRDVIGKDRTGSGKTLAFGLPLIEKLRNEKKFSNIKGQTPLMLCIVPTRELCIQVTKELTKLINFDGEFRIMSIYGGTSIDNQIYKIKNGIEIIIATPGRLIDLQTREVIKSNSLEMIVLDETDQMLNIGFKDDIEKIINTIRNETSNKPQIVLFSATIPNWVKDMANNYLDDSFDFYDLVNNSEIKTSKTVEHLALLIPSNEQKIVSISEIISVYGGNNSKSIIFTETKRDANEILLKGKLKIDANVLHGDIPQKQREVTFESFRNNKIQCLIATNVAARGLDIPEIDLILQLSPPKDIDNYIHRSGRTARAGKTGISITYYTMQEKETLNKIEKLAQIKFKQIGFPQPIDIIKASSHNIESSIENVPNQISDIFKEIATNILKKYKFEDALAKAMVLISGHNELLKQRSLLSSTENHKTFIIKNNIIQNSDFYKEFIKENFSNNLNNSISGLRLLKDQTGCIFDIESSNVKEIESFITKNKDDNLKITAPNELPELEDLKVNTYQNNNSYKNNKYNNNSDDQKLFINNISYRCEENDIIELFKNSNIELNNFFMPKDENDKIKGFAFGSVNKSDLDAALNLNGESLSGRDIKIQISNKQ